MFSRAEQRIRIGNIETSETEIRDILKAWAVVSFAFGMLLSGGKLFSPSFYSSFVLAALTVGVGFLFHELAHKLVAQRYGCFAEFRAFNSFLMLAAAMSFFGVVFAAPGAVMISGPVGTRRNGKISVAGPVTNIALAVAFLAILFAFPGDSFLARLAYYGAYINAWLAVFNMIPFWNFDGAKVWRWSKAAYFGTVILAGALMLAVGSPAAHSF